jgi:hypothetical protein
MSSAQDMDKYYYKVRALSEEKNELTPIERTIVLFRVAFESALEGLGPVGAVHAASHMMTMTLSVLDEDNRESSFDNILESFNTDCKMPN